MRRQQKKNRVMTRTSAAHGTKACATHFTEVEVFDWTRKSWIVFSPKTTDIKSPPAYARMHVLPKKDQDRLLSVSPVLTKDKTESIANLRLEPRDHTFEFEPVCPIPAEYRGSDVKGSFKSTAAQIDREVPDHSTYQWSSTLLPMKIDERDTCSPARILVTGAGTEYILTDQADGSWTTEKVSRALLNGDERKQERWHSIPVILPTGHVMIVGGGTYNFNPNAPDGHTKWTLTGHKEILFVDPDRKEMRVVGHICTARIYHSTALLTRKGYVWIGGSDRECSDGITYAESSLEIQYPVVCFSPKLRD